MRVVAMFLIACLVGVVPVEAQEQGVSRERASISGISDLVGRATVRAVLQPATQPGRGGRTMFWVGLVMLAGGGAMAALSGNVLANKSTFSSNCYMEYSGGPDICFSNEGIANTNQGFLWGGIAAAGTGIAMAFVGKARQRPSVEVAFTPGGAAVFRSLSF